MWTCPHKIGAPLRLQINQNHGNHVHVDCARAIYAIADIDISTVNFRKLQLKFQLERAGALNKKGISAVCFDFCGNRKGFIVFCNLPSL